MKGQIRAARKGQSQRGCGMGAAPAGPCPCITLGMRALAALLLAIYLVSLVYLAHVISHSLTS